MKPGQGYRGTEYCCQIWLGDKDDKDTAPYHGEFQDPFWLLPDEEVFRAFHGDVPRAGFRELARLRSLLG